MSATFCGRTWKPCAHIIVEIIKWERSCYGRKKLTIRALCTEKQGGAPVYDILVFVASHPCQSDSRSEAIWKSSWSICRKWLPVRRTVITWNTGPLLCSLSSNSRECYTLRKLAPSLPCSLYMWAELRQIAYHSSFKIPASNPLSLVRSLSLILSST